jgi:hypothetical protein
VSRAKTARRRRADQELLLLGHLSQRELVGIEKPGSDSTPQPFGVLRIGLLRDGDISREECLERPQDVQATLAELTASACARDVSVQADGASELLVCGGGSKNVDLMRRLGAALPGVHISATDRLGLPAMQVEACAFAWLARAFVEHEPGNLSAVTGARGPRILGALYPAGLQKPGV